MGRYIDWSKLQGRYPAANVKRDSIDIDEAFIKPSEFYIDGRLSVAYTVPFSSTYATIRDLVIDEARYRMMPMSDTTQTLKKDIENRIDMLVDGRMEVITDSGDAIQPRQSESVAWSTSRDYHPTLGHGESWEFVVSSDRLDDEASERL